MAEQQKPSIGRIVHYICGAALSNAASAEIHSGEGTGGSRKAGKHLPAIITGVKDEGDPNAQPPRPPKVDIQVFKQDQDEDFPEVGQSNVIIKDVPIVELPNPDDDSAEEQYKTAHWPEQV